ncbi:MAG: hypothetical protein JWM31_399, partial [Solirubrobacterales bacterium]|nr:hypothetical protein [Solirubrobacterales bacterium]
KVANCIDLKKHIPGISGSKGYDVIGPAGAQGNEAMDALQRVADVVAARQPGPLMMTPGANDAIWRVTDDADTDGDPDADAILQAAGVPVSTTAKKYAAPHYNDPNASNPQTQALGASGPLPAPAAPIEGVLPSTTTTSLLGDLRVWPRLVRTGARRAVFAAQFNVTGADNQVSLLLTRKRHGRTVTVAHSAPQPVTVGVGLLTVTARRLPPGLYTLVVHGAGGQQLRAGITVTRAPRKSKLRKRNTT